MPVDCFSPNQQNKLDFLVKCNYEFMSGPADNCTNFDILGRNQGQLGQMGAAAGPSLPHLVMGVQKHQNLSDSNEANRNKKREQKYNLKISESIEAMKKHYRHMRFFEAFVPEKHE